MYNTPVYNLIRTYVRTYIHINLYDVCVRVCTLIHMNSYTYTHTCQCMTYASFDTVVGLF